MKDKRKMLCYGLALFLTLAVKCRATDSDSDGLPDDWEISVGLDPYSAVCDDGATGDPDGDGLNNYDEYMAGTDPFNADSDDDGVNDYHDLDPLDPEVNYLQVVNVTVTDLGAADLMDDHPEFPSIDSALYMMYYNPVVLISCDYVSRVDDDYYFFVVGQPDYYNPPIFEEAVFMWNEENGWSLYSDGNGNDAPATSVTGISLPFEAVYVPDEGSPWWGSITVSALDGWSATGFADTGEGLHLVGLAPATVDTNNDTIPDDWEYSYIYYR